MRILNFPGYEEHHDLHEELTQQIVDLQIKIAAGKHSIGFELMHFLKVWLSKHIMEEICSTAVFSSPPGPTQNSAIAPGSSASGPIFAVRRADCWRCRNNWGKFATFPT